MLTKPFLTTPNLHLDSVLIFPKSRNLIGPENTRKWSGKKRDGRIPPPMAKIALKGKASSMSWEHTQISRREGRRSDSTLNGMNNLEGGCSVEPVSWEINGKEDGCDPWRDLIITGIEANYGTSLEDHIL
ncbi:hypothetical protein F2Q69_00016259 [Brassica cretica]|uniref:Uncharacterized protein n=1 Tax=Brassica cretica TaxID=69181 RepID=A0A8S9R750_BRACR|nr:hypothetical protein F2Q69_00016259 [Brassica cretica]